MRIFLGITLLVSLLCSVSQARDLTLPQTIQLAEAHSLALKKAGANSSGALSDLGASRADRLPTLSVSGTAFYVSEVPSLTISIPGTPVSLNRSVGTAETYQTDARLNLPLFTGGKISGGIDAASATSQYYQALEQASSDQVDYMARLGYLDLYRADRLVQAAVSAQQRTSVIGDNIKSLFAAGAADSVDLLDADLAVSKANLAVEQAKTNRRASEIRLITLLGVDPAESLNVTDSFPTPQLEAAKSTLSDSKPELKAADASVQLYQARTKLSQSDFWPTLSAFGGFSYGQPNLDRFNNTWNSYWTFGANLNWSFNLGSKTSRKVRAAKYYEEAVNNDRDQTRENLERDVSLTFEQLRLSYAAYQNAMEQSRIAGDDYRLARQQHQNGDLATNRLLEIQADLAGADASLAAAQADFYAAQSSYYYALGSDKIKKGF